MLRLPKFCHCSLALSLILDSNDVAGDRLVAIAAVLVCVDRELIDASLADGRDGDFLLAAADEVGSVFAVHALK